MCAYFLVIVGNLTAMATRVMTVCDVCGSPADGDTLRFGWSLTNYEIDLCETHREAVIDVMEMAATKGRRMGAPAQRVHVTTAAPKPREQVNTADVRTWAKRKRIKVNERGRLPDSIIERYLADQ